MSMPAPPPDTRGAGQSGHITDHNTISDAITALEAAVGALQASQANPALNPTPVLTAAYTASAFDLVVADISAGGFTVKLPSVAADKTRVAVKVVNTNTLQTNVLTVQCQGSDVLNKAGGPTTATITLTNQENTYQYAATAGIWYVISNDMPMSAVQFLIGQPETAWLPGDYNYLAWTYDPAMTVGQMAPGSGTIWLTRINVREPVSVTNVVAWVGTAGSGLTANQSFCGVYTSAGVLVAATADQSTSWQTGGMKQMALAGGPYVFQPGYYWVAFLSNGTTPPQFGRLNNFNGTITNAGLAPAAYRAATNTSGTSLPGTITPSSNASQQLVLWAAFN